MNMKNGFSTLNRLLGKKNKANTANGNLSKSTTNLSLSASTVNIDEASQMQYNRIMPLPVATSNAPFEQTFRITVLLPKDQLYVARLGARVPLQKLLELVCENKQLDTEKYEFRHPVDPSQVFSCELTIGAVGLSEVRLCNKSESYDTFNADEVIKLHRTSVIRDSLSSSEFSSRTSKHTAKTASPYSSSNSLNSMDSAGMNYTRTPVTPKIITPPVAPTRKKRMAPRPPSQNSIPEKSALITNGSETTSHDIKVPLPRKDFHVSSPNLYPGNTIEYSQSVISSSDFYKSNMSVDCNGNNKSSQDHNGDVIAINEKQQNGLYDGHIFQKVSRPLSMHILSQQDRFGNESNITMQDEKNARNAYSGSVQNLSSFGENKLPEPSPRKRVINTKKKFAPAPPPRESVVKEESSIPEAMHPGSASILSSASTQEKPEESSTEKTTAPTPRTRETTVTPSAPAAPIHSETLSSTPVETAAQKSPVPARTATMSSSPPENPATLERENQNIVQQSPPVATPRICPQAIEPPVSNLNTTQNNVSKVMLNRTPTPEPRLTASPTTEEAVSSAPPSSPLTNRELNSAEITLTTPPDDAFDDNQSKQADSGIGEPVPSPIPDSLPSENSQTECKSLSPFESSSDDDEMIKVYNLKLGRTIVKSLSDHNTLEDLTIISTEDESPLGTDGGPTSADTTSAISESASWNFTIPAPPNFADNERQVKCEPAQQLPDVPITPIINERPVLDFTSLTVEQNREEGATTSPGSPVDSPDCSLAIKQTADIEANSLTQVISSDIEVAKEELKISNNVVPAASIPPSPITQQASNAANIVGELNALINENRIDTLIKKADEPNSHIEAAKPNTLKNFSINSIAQTQQLVTATKEANSPSSPETLDEEKLYRKRGSITLSNSIFNHRKSITRSDSFHSTYQQQMENCTENGGGTVGLTSRSSSYLSLTKCEHIAGVNLNGRRSSSELSIAESPSLQSLVVMKSILNSRKNSLNNCENNNDIQRDVPSGKASNGKSVAENSSSSATKTVSTAPTSTAESLKVVDQAKVDHMEVESKKPEDLPKIYRYSGPPSINFSTWSERPKVQVSIKNEGDYIVGGKIGGSNAITTATMNVSRNSALPRSYRSSMPTTGFLIEASDAPKVPFVRSVEYKKTTPVGLSNKRYSIVTDQTTAAAPTEHGHGHNNSPPIMPKPTVTTIGNKFILGRMSTPCMNGSVGPTVKGFRSGDFGQQQQNGFGRSTCSTSTTFLSGDFNQTPKQLSLTPAVNDAKISTLAEKQSTLPRTTVNSRFPPGQGLLRSTSITQLDAKPKPLENFATAPFSQAKLRKTGLKEKIMANSGEDEQTAAVLTKNVTALSEVNTSLESAKIKLKSNVATAPEVITECAPPPPPPVIRAVLTKQNSNGTALTAVSVDSHNQLLASIRNFKRDELNRT